MGGFSPETRYYQVEKQEHRCALLEVEVTHLEGHHCVPKHLGGSNNPHNCIELAGQKSTTFDGEPVIDVHEICDQIAFTKRKFLHPDTLMFVTREEMPPDCFRNPNDLRYACMPETRKKHKKRKRKH